MKWNIFKPKPSEGVFVENRLKLRGDRRTSVFYMLGLSAVIGWLYIFLSSGIFDVSEIRVNDLEVLDSITVSNTVYRLMEENGGALWGSRNLLGLNAGELGQDLKDELFLENAIVDKVYPHTLILTFTERQNSLLVMHEGSLYNLDRNGFITEELSEEEEDLVLTRLTESPDQNSIPVLHIRETNEIVAGESFITEFRSKAWLDAFQSLQKSGFGYRNAILEYTTSTKLILNMYEPYDVYFDMLESLEPQIASFYTFMKARNQGIPIYSYVDARIPGKIFYR